MINPLGSPVKVKVVGIGGGGGNAISRMLKSNIKDVDYLSLNTDSQVLKRQSSVRQIGIGPNTTNGMGSGGHPEIGRKAIKESSEAVAEALSDTDLVFITAGMGGGTGTGAAPYVAEIARKRGALTVGIVTMPFSFEGPSRRAIAEHGLKSLSGKVDTVIKIENDRLLPSYNGGTKLDQAFRLADEVLRQGVQGISEIITRPGLINIDFADVKSIISNAGSAFMAMGEAKGDKAGIEAARKALANPLFETPIQGAQGILLNVRGSKNLTIGQVHEIADILRQSGNHEANIIFGIVQERRLRDRDKVEVTLVATGFQNHHGAKSLTNNFRQKSISASINVLEHNNQLNRADPLPIPAGMRLL